MAYKMKPTLFTCKLYNYSHTVLYVQSAVIIIYSVNKLTLYILCSDCLGLCFINLVQNDLDRIRSEWNCHGIRKSRQTCCPSGFPNELYQLPQLLGTSCMY